MIAPLAAIMHLQSAVSYYTVYLHWVSDFCTVPMLVMAANGNSNNNERNDSKKNKNNNNDNSSNDDNSGNSSDNGSVDGVLSTTMGVHILMIT